MAFTLNRLPQPLHSLLLLAAYSQAGEWTTPEPVPPYFTLCPALYRTWSCEIYARHTPEQRLSLSLTFDRHHQVEVSGQLNLRLLDLQDQRRLLDTHQLYWKCYTTPSPNPFAESDSVLPIPFHLHRPMVY